MQDLIWLGGLMLLSGSIYGLLRVYHTLSGRRAS